MKANERVYQVVVNDEEQYSIWTDERDPPAGWDAEGFAGTKDECLDHIAEVWPDIRPLSLRQRLNESKERAS